MFLSTRACLPFARLFFSAPKYFQGPATQAMFTETMFDVVDNNRQQSIVLFFFSFLLPMPYTPKALIKTFVKSKVVQFIDTVDIRCLADGCYFCVCNHT